MAQEKVKRFNTQDYWGKPVPSLGPQSARLLIVGLAPAAHGGNRTGRVFTGDKSGDWLFRAMHKAGFANQPHSIDNNDGLTLIDSYIAPIIHCAPPANKPLPEEIKNCRPYLLKELELLTELKVVIALGKIAFDNILSAINTVYPQQTKSPKPQFGHGLQYELPSGITLIASYHPSQQNTFTGKLTEPMLDAVFIEAQRIIQTRSPL